VAPWTTVLSQHTVFTIGVIYKFTLVWYSLKQGTTHIPPSHLAHLYTPPFLCPQKKKKHRRQCSWVHDFAGNYLLWWLSSRLTFFEPSEPDSEWVTANRISLMASTFSLIFSGHCSDTYNGLPYLDSSVWPYSCRNIKPLRYEHLQWEQNRSKSMIWLLYKIPAILGCPICYW
jgi:hypothetical protein